MRKLLNRLTRNSTVVLLSHNSYYSRVMVWILYFMYNNFMVTNNGANMVYNNYLFYINGKHLEVQFFKTIFNFTCMLMFSLRYFFFLNLLYFFGAAQTRTTLYCNYCRPFLEFERLIGRPLGRKALAALNMKFLRKLITLDIFSITDSNMVSNLGCVNNTIKLFNAVFVNWLVTGRLSKHMFTPFIDSCQTIRKLGSFMIFLAQ